MQNPKIIGLIVATVATIGSARSALATTYVFATFKGDDAAGMKLSTYTSTDSLNFTLVSDTGFGGNTGYLRDPSIMKYSDGKYYVVYTDPMTASCCNPEDHFGIAVSSDLIHWTDLTTVKAGVPAVSRTWAPEWYIEGGIVSVIANIDTGDKLPNFEPYVFTAQNSALTSWSGPTALGIGPDYIDTYVAKLGNTYHAFVKSEVTRYLEHATAPSLTGPWTFVGKDDWAGWGSGMEGPSIVQLDNGTFRMYVDSAIRWNAIPNHDEFRSEQMVYTDQYSGRGGDGRPPRHHHSRHDGPWFERIFYGYRRLREHGRRGVHRGRQKHWRRNLDRWRQERWRFFEFWWHRGQCRGARHRRGQSNRWDQWHRRRESHRW